MKLRNNFYQFLTMFLLLAPMMSSANIVAEYVRKLPRTFESAQRNEVKRDIFGNVISVNRRSYYLWNDVQRSRLNAALDLVSQRMLQPSILKCATDNAKVYYHDRCSAQINSEADYFNMTRRQLSGLLEQGFPNIHLVRWLDPNRKAGAVGNATVAEVVKVDNRGLNGSSVTGKFEVKIDVPFVDSIRDSQGIQALAGTIAHEMLHNMCHSHTDSYTDDNFMTVFGDCVQNAGTYVPRTPASLNLLGQFHLFDEGSRNPRGGVIRKAGIIVEENTVTLGPPHLTLALSATDPSKSLRIPTKMSFALAKGAWTVDKNLQSVPALVGHNVASLEQYSQYKVRRDLPFGLLLVNTGESWAPIRSGTVLSPGTYSFRINDQALGDNAGSIELWFYRK